jgi:hypothetical protein
MWLHLDLIKEMMAFCRSKFPVVEYGVVQIPTCAPQSFPSLPFRMASSLATIAARHLAVAA